MLGVLGLLGLLGVLGLLGLLGVACDTFLRTLVVYFTYRYWAAGTAGRLSPRRRRFSSRTNPSESSTFSPSSGTMRSASRPTTSAARPSCRWRWSTACRREVAAWSAALAR